MQEILAAAALTRWRFRLAGILLISLLVAYLDRVNVSVLVADNQFLTDMGIKGDPVRMGLLMTMFLLAYGVANVLLSPCGDILGPRKAMSLSIVLWAVSLCLGGVAMVFTTMIVARLLLGLGEGMHWPMLSKFVKNWFPPPGAGQSQRHLADWVNGWPGNCHAIFYLGYSGARLAHELFCAGGHRYDSPGSGVVCHHRQAAAT